MKNKVLTIRALNKAHEQLNVAQLRTMVQWFKAVDDLPIPTTRQLLLLRLKDTCTRNEPQPPFPPAVMPTPVGPTQAPTPQPQH